MQSMTVRFLILMLLFLLSLSAHCRHQNCIKYHQKQCLQCDRGYALDVKTKICTRIAQKQEYHIIQTQRKSVQAQMANAGIKYNVPSRVEQLRILSQLQIPYCSQRNTTKPQICNKCQKGYILRQNYCQQKIKNCQKYDQEEVNCLHCKDDLFLDANSCVDIHCTIIQFGTANCIECQTNYALNKNNNCVQNDIENCIQIHKGSCAKCKQGYYFVSEKRLCVKQPEGCNLFQPSKYECVLCKDGYHLTSQNLCQLNPPDPYCKTFQNNKCKQCSDRYYFSQNFTCISVNPLCKKYTYYGKCQQCYPGYTFNLQMNTCTVARFSYCKTQVINGNCLECYQGFFLNSSSLCQMVNPLCKTYHKITGQCLTCYQGYILSQKTCKLYNQDPNCKKYDSNSKCIQCYNRYFIKNQTCSLVSPLCKQFDAFTGLCTDCYQGYSLVDGKCKVGFVQAIKNCKVQQNAICVTCADSFYFDKNSNCVERNPLCKTFNSSNGFCTSCYSGYQLTEGQCQIQKQSQSSNDSSKNCLKKLNSSHCQSCFSGYSIVQGKCQKSNLNCKTFNPSKTQCLTCFEGYIVYRSSCLSMSEVIQKISQNVPNCLKSQKGVCQLCKEGFSLNQNGECL